MDVRRATRDDVESVRQVARESLATSYGHAIDADFIDEAVAGWYDPDDLVSELDDDDTVFVVAEDDGAVVGFAQSYVVRRREAIGEIDWLHVDPDRRGEGIGARLLHRLEEELLERGVGRLEGRVLAANEAGTSFYEQEGYDAIGQRRVRIGDGEYVERIYSKFPAPDTEGPSLVERTGPDGQRLYVAYDESMRGSTAPFYAVYEDEDREDRWGWFCGGDESFHVAVDSMDRFECHECGNRTKPSRWDAAYL
jgi:ribosomal protein S18 acetylase RimI-like enzyme